MSSNILLLKKVLKPRNRIAALALIGIAYFVIADIALYFLNPGYELIWASAGDYNVKSFGFLIASAFFGLGLGSLALVNSLYQKVSRPARSGTGLFLLGLWGMGMLIAGVFPANDGGSTVLHITTVRLAGIFPVEVEANPDTAFGWIHLLDMLGSFAMLTIAAFLLSWRFKREDKWRLIYPIALILALVMCIALILFVTALMFPVHLGFGPVIFIFAGLVIGVIWLFLIASHLHFLINRLVSE